MVTLGRDEEDAWTRSFEVQGTVKIHLLVFRLLHRWGLPGLCPLRDEIGVDVGLDGLPWAELKVEFA
jgi:hypothetical protein